MKIRSSCSSPTTARPMGWMSTMPTCGAAKRRSGKAACAAFPTGAGPIIGRRIRWTISARTLMSSRPSARRQAPRFLRPSNPRSKDSTSCPSSNPKTPSTGMTTGFFTTMSPAGPEVWRRTTNMPWPERGRGTTCSCAAVPATIRAAKKPMASNATPSGASRREAKARLILRKMPNTTGV